MNKEEDSKLTIKTALLNTIANGISLVVGMIMIPIITRVLTPGELGIASTFISTRNTFVILATCAVYSYIHKAMLEFKEKKKDYIYSITLFCICAMAVVFLICLPFKTQLMELLTLDEFLFHWLFISSLAFALYSVGNYYCIFHNKYFIVFVIVLSTGPVAQFLSLGLAYVIPKNRYIGRVIGLDFTYCVVALCVVLWMLFTRKKKAKFGYIRHTLHFTIPIIPHLLSQMVLTQCDLIMISYFAGEEKTGIYSMGHTIGFLAFTVMSQIMAAWSPWVYRRLEEKDTAVIYHNAKVMMLLGAYVSIGLLTVGTELVKIFLTEQYLPCIYIIPPLVLAMFFQFIYLFFYDLEYYHKKAKWIATASVAASLLNVVLNFLLIPELGYIAACYTTVASYLLLLVLNYLFSRKLGVQQVYNLKITAGISIFVIAYMFFIFAALDLVLVRYAVLVLVTVILLLVEIKDIKGLLLSIKG